MKVQKNKKKKLEKECLIANEKIIKSRKRVVIGLQDGNIFKGNIWSWLRGKKKITKT